MTDDEEIVEEVEGEVEPQTEGTTVTVEVPLDDVHDGIRETLEDAGVPVEEQLAQRLAPHAENALHEMYQQGRYSQ